ncbi:MAG: nucleotidyltransferase domain-containing protein [bacterium]|nr:nucleotidyltransferase domain-containing protein [bacterium]
MAEKPAGHGRFGLRNDELARIAAVFERREAVEEARIYGSRATGRHRPGSDIDIVIYGECNLSELAAIAGDLDELPLPYQFDVTAYSRIKSPELKQRIDEESQPLFKRGVST